VKQLKKRQRRGEPFLKRRVKKGRTRTVVGWAGLVQEVALVFAG